MKEEWRPVVGYESRYEVSNLGALRRTCATKGGRKEEMMPYMNAKGYLRIRLSHGTKDTSKAHRVHKLVAAAFIGPAPEKHEVNHIDADKQNNGLDNLEYVSHAKNMEHAKALGIVTYTRHKVKITDSEAREIMDLKGHFSLLTLSKVYGVSQQRIINIWSGTIEKPVLNKFNQMMWDQKVKSEKQMAEILREKCTGWGGQVRFAEATGTDATSLNEILNGRRNNFVPMTPLI